MLFFQTVVFTFIASLFFAIGFASPVPSVQPEARELAGENLVAQKGAQLVRAYERRAVDKPVAKSLERRQRLNLISAELPTEARDGTIRPFNGRSLNSKRQEINSFPVDQAAQSLDGNGIVPYNNPQGQR